MIWLFWKLVSLPVRVVLGAVKMSFRTLRLVGLDRLAAFGAGVAAGVALAPSPAAELRSGVAARQEARAARGGDLAATVRHELANSPRTWHLPQPGVTVDGDRVTLTGTVPHDQARLDLVRAAGAIAGVRAVDDRIAIDSPDP